MKNKKHVKMEKPSAFLTIKRTSHKGFTMVDVLLMLCVVGVLSMMSFPFTQIKPSHRHHQQVLAYAIDHAQLHAIAHHKRTKMPFLVDRKLLHFNALGNINQAKHGVINEHPNLFITFYLGFGRYVFH